MNSQQKNLITTDRQVREYVKNMLLEDNLSINEIRLECEKQFGSRRTPSYKAIYGLRRVIGPLLVNNMLKQSGRFL